jgi:hypothetical protein
MAVRPASANPPAPQTMIAHTVKQNLVEAAAATAPISTIPGEAVFHPLPPMRILDTRTGSGAPLGPGGTLRLQVTGRGGVPAIATALVYNLTITQPTGSGFLTVYPSGAARPNVSNINFVAGQTMANSGTTKLGADGSLTIFNDAG